MKMFRHIALLAVVGVSFMSYAQEKPVTEEEFEEVKGALQGVMESAAEYRGYVDALRKIKLSGYVQPQYRLGQVDDVPYSYGGFSGGTFPQYSKSQFQIRRARFKIKYDNVLTQLVLQVDFGQTAFTTKDAYALLIDPWVKSFGFQIGLFDRPFGYEISYSSSNRESPERSRFTQTLFPGEREAGAKLFFAPQDGPLSFLRADVGIFNGSGPTALEFDNYKDAIGRVGAQLPLGKSGAELDLGVSGYYGWMRNQTKYLYRTGTLPNGSAGWIVDSAATNFGDGVPRRYAGLDAQFYYDLPVLGGMILRGEVVTGKQPGSNSTSVSFNGLNSSGIYARNFVGWYLYYIQNMGAKLQTVVKYDVYDPNTEVSSSDFTDLNTSGSAGLNVGDLKYSTLGLGLVYHWDDHVKFILYYEWVSNEELSGVSSSSPLAVYRNDAKDNILTFRTQFKF